MKAIVCHRYGSPDVLQLVDLPTPFPGDGEVLLKVQASSVNAADWHLLRADPFLVRLAFGMFRRRFTTLGSDVAGRVEAVGRNVTRFKPGDEVFGDLFSSGFGAFAEYARAKANALAPLPPGILMETAAATPLAGGTALQALRDRGQVQAGQRVLIHGASGGVGTFAVQIARAFGAEVTAVCRSENVALVRGLGAQHVIDYTREDFAASGERFDLILAVGGYRPILDYRRALSANGRYIMVGGAGWQMVEAMLYGPLLSMAGDRKMGNMLATTNQENLETLASMLKAGSIVPVIARRYPLREVPEAIRYVETGHAPGKVVITV